ncbi:MAG TPA: PA0069 family radical SAM protein [Methylophilaceae bacterium]|nr:PA0069 family radical SAM protein [Methylophilaceae bacterium]
MTSTGKKFSGKPIRDNESPRPLVFKGRGTVSNTVGRFEQLERVEEDDGWDNLDTELVPVQTEVILDSTRTIINYVNSPDISFDRSINPYRGCEHGCTYCFARPTHTYLGYSAGLDFESRILIKPDAAELLKKELAKPSYVCAPIAMGTNTDPYQPLERKYKITRSILEVLAEYKHPVTIVTKNALIERDIDILAPMAAQGLARVFVSVTTLNKDICRTLEPRAAAPHRRLEAIKALSEAGIPTGVMTAPILPVLTDTEMEAILEAAANAGAKSAGYVMLRLPLEVAPLFEEWLKQYFPLKADHVMSIVKQSRGGKAYDSAFFKRQRGTGLFADMIAQRFKLATKKLGMNIDRPPMNTALFSPPRPSEPQMSLFE